MVTYSEKSLVLNNLFLGFSLFVRFEHSILFDTLIRLNYLSKNVSGNVNVNVNGNVKQTFSDSVLQFIETQPKFYS